MKYAILALLVLMLPLANADLNPKTVSEITARITQEGSLHITGYIEKANITLYIPQDGIVSQDITGDGNFKHTIIYDKYGNRKLLLEWKNPSGIAAYKITTVVNNKAKTLSKAINTGDSVYTDASNYLQETRSIVISNEIRKAAFPYTKTIERVAEMTMYVHGLMTYDISLVGERKSSAWAFENRRGVCVEHANLLTAMLRAAGIPTRYITGYAYSSVDKRLIGHTWVEVLAEDGAWVAFDPTWLEGGYLDATHIKTASLPDDEQSDILTYFGTGSIKWERGTTGTNDLYTDKIDILDIKSGSLSAISLSDSGKIGFEGWGYVSAAVETSTCTISELSATSCVDSHDRKVLSIQGQNQAALICGEKNFVWFMKENSGSQGPYKCPVTIYDQLGIDESIAVEVGITFKGEDVIISGPSVVGVNENFELKSSEQSGFVFYSTELGLHNSDTWELKLEKPGEYHFFLFKDGSVDTKEVVAVDKKEFEISIGAPQVMVQGESAIISATVKNLLGARSVNIILDFEKRREQSAYMSAGEEKTFYFNITATEPGTKQLSLSATGDSIVSTSASIKITEKAKETPPFQFLSDFFGIIANFFSSLFRR